jgi:DNA repair exonuclease SbcCD ATPase subunit
MFPSVNQDAMGRPGTSRPKNHEGVSKALSKALSKAHPSNRAKKGAQKVDEITQKVKTANLTDGDLEKLKKEISSAKEDAKREEEAAQNRSKAISKAQPSNRAKEATQKVDELEQKLKAANLTDSDLEKLKKELSSAKEAAKREKEAAVLHRLTLSLGGLTRQYNTVEQAGADKGDVVYTTTLAFKKNLIKEAKDVKDRFVNTQVARDTLAGKLRDLCDGEEQEKNDLEKKLMEAKDVLEEIAESVNQTRAQMKTSTKKRKSDLDSVIAKAKKAKEGSMMS